jgi:hypothetical protein
MLTGMELRRLLYFEALAHELHFGLSGDRHLGPVMCL